MRNIDFISDKNERFDDVKYEFIGLVPEHMRGLSVPCFFHVCVCVILWKDDAETMSVGKSTRIAEDNEPDEMKKEAFLDALKESRKQWKHMTFNEFERTKARSVNYQ